MHISRTMIHLINMILTIAQKTVTRFAWPAPSSGRVFLILFAALAGTVNAAVYDLSSGWSNSSNPNGPWSYNQGRSPLPTVSSFNFANTGWASSCNQPAWAPSNVTGRFLPAFVKINACAAASPTLDPNNSQPNLVAGDVIVHTVDGFNGNASLGVASVLFTLPAGGAGAYTIIGSLWDATLGATSSSRPQDWSLFLNGTQIANGRLSGAVSRSQSQAFNLVENLKVGDQVELQIVHDPVTSSGFVVGINLTITLLQPPAITINGIVPVFSSSPVVQPGSWVSIYGNNFAGATTVWNGNFPTSLGDVSVTINQKPAYLWFVGPTQINLQAPDDTATGTVIVSVTTPAGSASSTVTLAQYGPSFNLFNNKYAAAIVPTPGSPGNSGAGYDYIGPTGGLPFSSRPLKAGEIVLLYGVGFGPTTPLVPAGQAFSGAAPSVALPRITIGGVPATVSFAGIIQAGLFQFNVVVPNAASGDQLLQASVGAATTPNNVFLTLQ